jgi:hypothetical protein
MTIRNELRPLARRFLPAAAQCFVEVYQGLQAGEPRLGERISRSEESLLRLQHIQQIGHALCWPPTTREPLHSSRSASQ